MNGSLFHWNISWTNNCEIFRLHAGFVVEIGIYIWYNMSYDMVYIFYNSISAFFANFVQSV